MNSEEGGKVGVGEGSVSQPKIDQQPRRPLRQALTKQGAKSMATAIERLGILLKLLGRDDVEIHLNELVRLEISSTPASNV